MKKRLSGGFTLIEMMVVIVILGVLALVLVVSFAGKDDKAKKAATRSIIEQVSNQIEEFKMDHGQYPQSLEELRRRPGFVSDDDWTGPYLKKKPKDGWGREFHYESPGPDGYGFQIYSLGADDQPGGKGFDADLSNIQEDD